MEETKRRTSFSHSADLICDGLGFFVGFGLVFIFPRGCKQKIDTLKKTILPWKWIKTQNVYLVPKNVTLSVRVKIFWLKMFCCLFWTCDFLQAMSCSTELYGCREAMGRT